MSRSSAHLFTVTLVELLLVVSAGCSTSTGSSRDIDPRGAFAGDASLLVGPGTLDVENVHLPAVMVSAGIPDPEGGMTVRPCSGVLIHPRVAVTAGHCVCLSRSPLPRDKRPRKESATPPTATPALTRAHALEGVLITNITDTGSSCARVATVTALHYEPSKKGRSTSPGWHHHHGCANAVREQAIPLHQHLPPSSVVIAAHPVRGRTNPCATTD